MLTRTIQKNTRLVHDGQLIVTIIYPQIDPAYLLLAKKLADTLNHLAANQVLLLADRDVMPAVNQTFPNHYRFHPLILLGNLNTNRALLTLYARYYCFTDALYPGGDGYDLRTLVNPYGRGANVILAGGSTVHGVERAVDRLIDHIHSAGQQNELILPFILEVELEPSLKQKLYEWPDAPLNAPLPDDSQELLVRVGAYSMMYAATGDRRFGELGAAALKTVNARMTTSYGDRHYFIERVMRAIPWLGAGGFLDDADILRTDELLMGMALSSQDAWWRMKSATPPLGHRHHGKGTYEFYLIARYLREQASPEPELAALCDRWITECQAFLDGLGRAGIDDQDDESTLNNLSTIFWYSLSEERYAFFESGGARAWALRVIALHDNLGAAAGPGGYGESLLGMPYVQEEAATPVASCAFYYQDGRFKWILEHLPRLNPPVRGGFWAFCPIFIHKFDTGLELEPQEPQGLTGLQVLPVSQYQFELNNNPPQHLEFAGHMVNAPENWLSPEGVGANHLPRERGFDKVALRSGFGWEDPYLVIQGYQGGFRWQGHMKAANCILRFGQNGHIFLMQNTRAHSQYFKNGVLVSDGFNNSPIPPIAEWLALDDFPQAGLSVTRLNDYHHTAWSRHLFWAKGLQNFYVVIDCVSPEADGEYSLVCSWRSLMYASLQGRTWTSDQGDHCFTLCCSEPLYATNEEERDLGAVSPYVLHQFKGGRYAQNEPVTIQNVFYVRPIHAPEEIDIRRIAPNQATILRAGTPYAWIGVAPDRRALQALGLEVQAASAWVTPEALLLAGALRLDIPGSQDLSLFSDGPLGVDLDLVGGKLTARIDGPSCDQVTLQISLGGKNQQLALVVGSSIVITLPDNLCREWSSAIRRELEGMNWPEETMVTPALPALDPWERAWEFNATTPIPERVREMTISAAPPPVDGIAEQLIDTMPTELRETWQLWPKAPFYEITLTFPDEKAIRSLTLIGDSKDEPIFKVFHTLPSGIQVEASRDGFKDDHRACQVDPLPSEISFKRFRGILDRLETRQVAVNQAARQLRITLPSPDAGDPLVLQEIAVSGSQLVAPAITHLLSADLDGNGQLEVLTVDAANELIVLEPDGRERWRYPFPGVVNHISCHDLLGDGSQYVCAGLLGGDLVILSPDGKVWKHLKLAEKFFARKDVFFGWLYTIYSLAVWQRDDKGRAALALGCYSLVVFLDPDGEIIGHSWADAPWLFDTLVTPLGEPGENDLWVRCGWNHGISHYEGQPGFDPSGAEQIFSGVHQPMFRALRKIIPFVNGRTAAFEWNTRNSELGRVIVAAAEDGVGVLSTRIQDFLWKVEGGTTLTACINLHQDGQDVVIVGGVDGFVASFNLADGHPLHRWWARAAVVGLAAIAEGNSWAAVTEQGAWLLDAEWRPLAFYSLEATKMCEAGDQGIVMVTKNGSLVRLTVHA